ncbi:Plasma-membrane_choline transporter domain-containing protein [Hexamita inflata]|uniref:Plasma-membrane choline transporter domain-containing protein n=1 Tax=Hexamita inflata TaxID=28002 RepID=A0AA86TEW0_9EUKA|nr:Plasma-membrane choline transporter domain-containing protein [Hexamita inflata]
MALNMQPPHQYAGEMLTPDQYRQQQQIQQMQLQAQIPMNAAIPPSLYHHHTPTMQMQPQTPGQHHQQQFMQQEAQGMQMHPIPNQKTLKSNDKERKDEIAKLSEDRAYSKKRKCTDCGWILVYILELVLLVIILTVSNVRASLSLSTFTGRYQLMSAESDPMYRVCGYSSVSRTDPRSPNIQQPIITSNLSVNKLTTFCKLLKTEYTQVTGDCDSIVDTALDQTVTVNQQKYYQMITELSAVLPEPGKVAYKTPTGTICLAEDAIINNSCQLETDYVCTLEFGVLMNKIDNNLQFGANKQQFTTDEMNNAVNSIKKNSTDDYSFLTQLCKPVTLSEYTLIGNLSDTFVICNVDESSTFDKIFGNTIKFPAYVDYLINYVMNIKSKFISELVVHGIPIVWSFATSVACSYVYVAIILIFTKFVVIISSAAMPLIFIAIGVGISILINNQSTQNVFMTSAFGYSQNSQTFLQAILFVIAIVCFLLGFLTLLNFLSSISAKAGQANNISLCKDVLKKRFRMFFNPIIFVLLLLIHIGGCGVIMAFIILGGSYDSELKIISFNIIDQSTGIIKSDWQRIASLTFVIIFLVQGLYFYKSLLNYHVSNMVYIWYNDRVSMEFKEKRKEYLLIEKNKKSTRYIKEIQKAGLRVRNDKYSHDVSMTGKIDQKYFALGRGRAYIDSTIQLFKNLGSLIFYSITQTILLLPRVLLSLIYYIQQSLNIVNDKDQKQNCCTRGFERCIEFSKQLFENIMRISSKNAILYCSLTGRNYIKSGHHQNLVFGVNVTFVNEMTSATSSIVWIGRLVVAVVVIILEQLIGFSTLYKTQTEQWEFQLTPVICCLIISVIISDMILQVIGTVNISMLMMYNFEQKQGLKQNVYIMPKQLTRIAERYNLKNADDKFRYKETIKLLVGEPIDEDEQALKSQKKLVVASQSSLPHAQVNSPKKQDNKRKIIVVDDEVQQDQHGIRIYGLEQANTAI